MHFAEIRQREALDALSRVKTLRARLREEVDNAQAACRTAREIIREPERLRRALEVVDRR